MAEPKDTPKKTPRDSRTQQQRFEDFAREHGATDEVLDAAMKDIAGAPRKSQPPPKGNPQD